MSQLYYPYPKLALSNVSVPWPAALRTAHGEQVTELETKCARLDGDVTSIKDILESESLEVERLQVTAEYLDLGALFLKSVF